MLLSLLVSIAFAAPSVPLKFKGDPAGEFKCFKQMKDIIKDNSPVGEWRMKVKPDLTPQYLRPTKTLSKWIKLEKNQNEEIVIRETPFDQMIVRFDKNCKRSMSVVKTNYYQTPNGFTDYKLAQTVQKNKSGIIYTWSPNMNLSVEGIKYIQEVAKNKKLSLTIVLDPYANEAKAKKMLTKNGLGKIQVQKLSSIEMINRNTLLHFPNILMFKDGKMQGPMVPGLLSSHDYSIIIKKYLE
jgi:hypothetical protein